MLGMTVTEDAPDQDTTYTLKSSVGSDLFGSDKGKDNKVVGMGDQHFVDLIRGKAPAVLLAIDDAAGPPAGACRPHESAKGAPGRGTA